MPSRLADRPANVTTASTGAKWSEPSNRNGAGIRVLILGGGVIGTSIAYHLTARGADVVVLERSAVACAASGKSGGFLALDWCDGTPLMALARRSFGLHADLADALGGDWGYRRITTYAGIVGRSSTRMPHGAG